jgi:hypothetical protein
MLPLRVRSLGLCLAAAALIALSASASARADTVTDWNVNAVNALVTTAGQGPTVSTVHLAMVHSAVYDAVNSIDERYEPYLVEVRARDWYSKDAAVAAAAYRVLLGIVPTQESALTPLYNASLAPIPDGAAKDGGIRVGEVAAAAMLADRKNDGRFGAYRFPVPVMPKAGEWRPVLPAFGNDPAAWIKDVRPFLIREPYASPAPYALTSKKYAREFDEVKTLGATNSATRTADQTDQARFWAGGPAPWTLVARQLATAHGLRSIESARMYAMLYTTGADALISVWNGKAEHLFWRPITAIREADADGNPATEPDTGWLPLINNPPYPEQPSGLSSVSGAMGEALEHVFGKRERFSVTSGNSGTTRSYSSFDQAVDEVVDARVYSGVHFRKADEDGARIGHDVAHDSLKRYFERD